MPRRNRQGAGGQGSRGVAIYPLVLALAMLLTVTGLTLLAVRRADHAVHMNSQRSVQAQYVALAGIEAALRYLEETSAWRTTLANGNWFVDQTFGPGTYTVAGTDPDGSLSNNEAQPVTLTSTGTVNGAVSKVQVTLVPRTHPALRYACFSQTTLEFDTNVIVKGPMRANKQVGTDGNAVLQGSTEYFETVTGWSIDSRLTPARFANSAMAYPQPSLSYYLALATPISGTGITTVKLSKYVLTPTRNSETPSAVNARGIYSLDAAGRAVVIEKTRIKGTLIVHNTSNNKVTIEHANVIEPAGSSYPTMLIYAGTGDVEFCLDQAALSESSDKVDYNEDSDQSDSLSTAVRGLIWAEGSCVQMYRPSADFKGCLIGASIKAYDSAGMDWDSSLAQVLIPGFIQNDMRVVQGSWREVQP